MAVITPSIKACALIVIGGPRFYMIDARISKASLIRRIASGHVTYIKNNSVELSPTWRKLREGIGFITCRVFRGLIILSNKRKAIHIINYISKYKYVASCRVGTAWARVALPRGLAWHVVSTWVLRGNIPLFAYI